MKWNMVFPSHASQVSQATPILILSCAFSTHCLTLASSGVRDPPWRDWDHQENVVSARYCVNWDFCFEWRVSRWLLTLCQFNDNTERPEVHDLIRDFAGKFMAASLCLLFLFIISLRVCRFTSSGLLRQRSPCSTDYVRVILLCQKEFYLSC